jgi:hypothetical protein
MIPAATADFYRAQQHRTVVTVALMRREWRLMGADFDRSWATVGPRLTLLAGSSQLGAAHAAIAYVPKVLAETGQPNDPSAEVDPHGFAGVAADGRSLDGLLYGAVTTSKTAVGNGATPSQGLAVGGRWLDMATQTLVADAGRQATGVGIATRPNTGYVRQVNPPSCSRCAMLAGRWYRYSDGFSRHPRCDCQMIPSSEDVAGDFTTDPKALVDRGLVTDLTPAETQALDLGADLNQVVNARRGSSGLRGLYTTEGTTRRGYASLVKRQLDAQRGQVTRETRGSTSGTRRVTRTPLRPTPEAIYRYAHDRADALQLLAANGYIVA